MRRSTLKAIENCSIEELKSILNSIGINNKTIFLDFILEDEIIAELLDSLLQPLEIFLEKGCEMHGVMITTAEANRINEIIETFFEEEEIYEKELSYFLPFVGNVNNLYQYKQWKDKEKENISFYQWIEFDCNRFFEFMFREA
jgi:hypothetical protein